jgi:hypothetical protein
VSRHAKRPDISLPRGYVFGMEMLREDARRIFKKHGAPSEWGERMN